MLDIINQDRPDLINFVLIKYVPPKQIKWVRCSETHQKTRHGSKMFDMALHVDHIYVFFYAEPVFDQFEKYIGRKMTSAAIPEARCLRGPSPAGSKGMGVCKQGCFDLCVHNKCGGCKQVGVALLSQYL